VGLGLTIPHLCHGPRLVPSAQPHLALCPPPHNPPQLGPANDLRLRALLDLAEQVVFEPCYDALRTKEQARGAGRGGGGLPWTPPVPEPEARPARSRPPPRPKATPSVAAT
jgi:hypothetical protein